MSRYRETLHAWAVQHVPEGAKVLAVDVEDNPGYRYSSYTYEDPSIEVWVSYEMNGEQSRSLAAIENLGEILTALFAIEDDQ